MARRGSIRTFYSLAEEHHAKRSLGIRHVRRKGVDRFQVIINNVTPKIEYHSFHLQNHEGGLFHLALVRNEPSQSLMPSTEGEEDIEFFVNSHAFVDIGSS